MDGGSWWDENEVVMVVIIEWRGVSWRWVELVFGMVGRGLGWME